MMASDKKALLILGSPRGHRSASYALGGYLMQLLGARGVACAEIWLHELAKKPDGDTLFIEAVVKSDILILACPLYIDSLPAIATRALTLLFAKHKIDSFLTGKNMCLIINSGFPETYHSNTAAKIAENFARMSSVNWLGALALGMGGAYSGKPLDKIGMPVKHIYKALDLAAESLAENRPIPESAIALLAKKPKPYWLYNLMGDLGWKKLGKKYGTSKKLKARPYSGF